VDGASGRRVKAGDELAQPRLDGPDPLGHQLDGGGREWRGIRTGRMRQVHGVQRAYRGKQRCRGPGGGQQVEHTGTARYPGHAGVTDLEVALRRRFAVDGPPPPLRRRVQPVLELGRAGRDPDPAEHVEVQVGHGQVDRWRRFWLGARWMVHDRATVTAVTAVTSTTVTTTVAGIRGRADQEDRDRHACRIRQQAG